jgi:mycothiol synthase
MSITIDPWTEAAHDLVRSLAAEEELAPQVEQLLGPGRLEHSMADPYCHAGLRFIARDAGVPAGFAFGFLLSSSDPPWAMLRVAVSASRRRRGIGTRLLEAQLTRLPDLLPGCREICLSAYEPCPPGEAFAARHGFRIVRRFWLMERSSEGLAAPAWPPGITTRGFDGGEVALRDWNDAYNASFASHYHFVPSTIEEAREMVAQPEFDPASVLLAYDGGRCVAFCRNEVHAGRGEIAALGVAPAWQGRGLGRALLRWGARWLLDRGALPITLMVDGGNETALRLYRAEGFAVAKTRLVWSRAATPA